MAFGAFRRSMRARSFPFLFLPLRLSGGAVRRPRPPPGSGRIPHRTSAFRGIASSPLAIVRPSVLFMSIRGALRRDAHPWPGLNSSMPVSSLSRCAQQTACPGSSYFQYGLQQSCTATPSGSTPFSPMPSLPRLALTAWQVSSFVDELCPRLSSRSHPSPSRRSGRRPLSSAWPLSRQGCRRPWRRTGRPWRRWFPWKAPRPSGSPGACGCGRR